MAFLGMVSVALLVVLISSLWKVLLHLIWRPYVMTKAFRKQGLRGAAYKFWSGSIQEINKIQAAGQNIILDNQSHDITLRVMGQHRQWTEQYGTIYTFWFGAQPRIVIGDPEMAKQVLSSKLGFFVKPEIGPNLQALIGKGLVFVEGSDWVRHRRIVNPAFNIDKLKMLTKEMARCTKLMLEDWQAQILQEENQHKEVEVAKQLKELTANIISHTAFGSSYMEGKEVFLLQQKLEHLAAESVLKIDIPGYRYLPTKKNRYRWNLEKALRRKLMGVIKGRLESNDHAHVDDLLGLMMKANEEQDGQTMSIDEIIDECKTFFFGGHETTSHLLTWTMFLLSTYPDWQEKLREEVLRECGMETPDANMLSKLKLVNMVLLETLRLYSPIVMLGRKACKDLTVGNINIPKDTLLLIPIALIHRSKDIWGADANEFNPIRFENGISKASKDPNAMLAFSIGPRGCIGQNFAMLEAKTAIVMILQRFSFSLSKKYKHAPVSYLTLQPGSGLPIVFRPLRS